jgi:signal transduction histidine kinase
MRRLIPRSAARQLAATVVGAVLLAFVIVVVIWEATDSGTMIPRQLSALEAETTALLRLLQTLPPALHDPLLASARETGLVVTPLDGMPSDLPPDLPFARMFSARLVADGVATRMARLPDPAGVLGVALQLADGSHVGVSLGAERAARVQPNHLIPPMTLLLLVAVPLVIASFWLVRRVSLPLTRLARAAEGIGRLGEGEPLPEAGTTEIRQLAHAINQLLARLREDMTERARLMAAISHDLRTPLTRLHLRLSTVADAELREKLLRDVRGMEQLVADSLALLETELRREPLERIDVAALAATVCDEFADAGHDVIYCGPRRCAVRCQPRAVERAIANLVDNALKHAGPARVHLVVEGTAVRLRVEDDGPGIAEELLPAVTEEFRRGPTAAPGLGLGLAFVAGVARAHGGALRLRNRQSGGLRAELLLPVG